MIARVRRLLRWLFEADESYYAVDGGTVSKS